MTAIVVINTKKMNLLSHVVPKLYDFILWSIKDDILKSAFLSLQCSAILA